MEWKLLSNGDWEAKGENGRLLIYKDPMRKGWYRCNYKDYKEKTFIYLPAWRRTAKELKQFAENSKYWNNGTERKTSRATGNEWWHE